MMRRLFLSTCAVLAATPAISSARQTESQPIEEAREDGTVVIDILVPVPTTDEADATRACGGAGDTTGGDPQIVVCGEPVDDSAYLYTGSNEAAENRYAAETAFAGEIRAPDVAGPGIFTGPPTVSNLCGFIFNPCPPPPALIIDVEALPPAPAGSDAARIAQGLEPLDVDEKGPRELTEWEKAELGLPPVPDFAEAEDPNPL